MKQAKEFEKNSIILFIIMMLGNVCNYLFQIIVGNLMTVEDYGVVNTVLAIIAFFSIPTTIITMISARYMALNIGKDSHDRILSTLRFLYKMATIIGALLLLTGILFAGRIAKAFDLESGSFVYGAMAIVMVNLLYSISAGTLQGLKKFIPYGLQGVFVAGVKLVGSVILVLLGMRIYGVLLAIGLGTVFAIIYAARYVGRELIDALRYKGPNVIDIQEFVGYALGTIISQSCVIALTNGDILMVKFFFTEREAGIYSSAMVIGKIAMYVSTAVIATFFPMVVEKYERKEPTLPLLKKAMLYGGGMALLCSIGMITLGRFVIGILFGQKYLDAIAYLPYVCIYIVPLTFLTIFMNYFLAVNRSKAFALYAGITLIAVLLGCSLGHDSIPKMMTGNGIIMTVVDVFITVYAVMKDRKYAKN